ncbi:olfactory receptor-like protein OLF4 [Spea bombifrons]|uniref:olfactory receptor-like protein OLF4 n=1 Tax=Spea bombifrons TaxID=233779 RepID=UPI002349640B|nr:olfactory receptor-like protein OLF4 [Spea bombifrons]
MQGFYILAFYDKTEKRLGLFILFFLMYVMAIIGNLGIITAISIDVRLHTPMYVFLWNLSCVDTIFPTVTLPKLMDILLTGNNFISFVQCFTQMYFFTYVAGSEVITLSFMAYDRYVAICYPLHYLLIMNTKKCIITLLGNWLLECVNAFIFIIFALKLSLVSNKINNFFCDVKAVAKISCTESDFNIVILVEALLFGVMPFLFSLISYIKIISSILCISTNESRKKAFSTCASHFTVITIYYATALWMYVRPSSEHSEKQDPLFSLIHSVLTPMLNPLIYSLRNKEIKRTLRTIIGFKPGSKKKI